MRTRVVVLVLLFLAAALIAIPPLHNRISLPSSKLLIELVPGNPQPMNTLPVNIQISPDQKYAAVLEAGFGDLATDIHQSIAVLDFATNQITRFADPRLGKDVHQIADNLSDDVLPMDAASGEIIRRSRTTSRIRHGWKGRSQKGWAQIKRL
jgi:hypothetical protein